MVMEVPGPQLVGREFVRQYYTLLHEAPEQLHRFYSFNSSYIHGGVEKPGEELPPVTGQKDIHEKIVSLNFVNCHAKIRQVDSQLTLTNAVVVQVTGELSNNGEPMRRFMQTFVLAQQASKKFYVHNDIFRYQDEVFEEDLSDMEDENGLKQVEGLSDGDVGLYSRPTFGSNGHHGPVEEVGQAPQPASSDGLSSDEGSYTAAPPAPAEQVPAAEPEAAPSPPPAEEEPEEEKEEPKANGDSEALEEVAAPEPEQEPEPEQQEQPAQPQVKSWANLVRNTSSAPAPVAPVTQSAPKPAPLKPAVVEAKPATPAADPNSQPQPQRGPRGRGERGGGPAAASGIGRGAPAAPRQGGDEPRTPDSFQIFVGNLPHHASERDLKDHFAEWGTVTELRIRRNDKNVPNFGFAIFDSAEAVQRVLSDPKARTFQDNHRLNIEEKKARGPGPDSRSGRGGPSGGRPPFRGSRGGGAGGSRSDSRGAPPSNKGGFNARPPPRS